MFSAFCRCWRVPEARCVWGRALHQHCGGLPVQILWQRVPHDSARTLWGWVCWENRETGPPSECWVNKTVKCRAGSGGASLVSPYSGPSSPFLSLWWHLLIQAHPSSSHLLDSQPRSHFHGSYFPSSCSFLPTSVSSFPGISSEIILEQLIAELVQTQT